MRRDAFSYVWMLCVNRVFKGKKMPGRMGSERVTVQNLKVLKVRAGAARL
jgi:ribosomal protein L3